MQKGIKDIRVFLLCFTGLVFFSHAVIPHYHHFNSILEYNHLATHKDGHSGNHPLHCHSLNDLATDETVISTNKISLGKTLSDIAAINNIRFQYSGSFHERINSSATYDSILSFVFLKNSPSRGSPVTA